MASSIPTQTDKHSRPVKRRALSPSSKHSASVTALFANPPPLPASTSLTTTTQTSLPAPPEIVTNVQGSSAGAGSGEFHVYKASRRREYERLARMDEESREEKAKDDWEAEREEKRRRDEERTEKNRVKRRGRGKDKDRAKGKEGEVKGPGLAKAGIKANGTAGGRVVQNDEEEESMGAVAQEEGITFADDG